MADSFESRIFKRAWTDTASFATVWQNFLAPALLVAAGGGLDLYLHGIEAVKSEITGFLIYALVPLGAFFLLLFLWNLWLAPFKLLLESMPGNGSIAVAAVPAPAKEADWAEWAKVPKYKVWQAAKLWHNIEPTTVGSDLTSPIYNRLIADLDSRKLEPVDMYDLGDQVSIGPHTEIYRNHLIKYAEAAGEKPKFLFP